MWCIKNNRVLTEYGVYYITPEDAKNLNNMIRDGFGHWAFDRCAYLIEMGYAVKSKARQF